MNLKESDLIKHPKIGRPPRSIARGVRRRKAEGKIDEAKKLWEDDRNKPNHIRERVEKYLEKVGDAAELFYPKEFQKEFKKLKRMSPEQAKEKLKKYNKIIIPKEGEKELNFGNLEDVDTYITHGPKGKERLEFWTLFSKAYPKLMFYLFSVNGKGKTHIEKITTMLRRKSP